ncbi:MAG: MFS transporter [Alphaproteobacteria bacterium]|nr:MAG: MFS transporter [Alphaproteobacteria bacterium]
MERKHAYNQYRWYMSGQGFYFFAGGIGFVLKQWLIAFYLHETPQVLGLAQMVMSLPQLVFILIGGLAADRLELRTHLVRLQVLAAVSMSLLCIFLLSGALSVWAVVSVGVLDAIIAAFAQPARDSLLNRVTQGLEKRTLQQTVTIANMLQFGAQILGMMLFNLVRIVGPVPIIVIQAGLALSAAYSTTKLDPSPPEHKGESSVGAFIRDIRDGLKESFSSPLIRPVMIWLSSFGFISMGVYMVVLPLMVRDIYHGGALEFSLIHVGFFGGVTITSYFLSKVGHFRYQGRMLLLAQTGTISSLLILALNPEFHVFIAAIFLWGVAGALSMSMTRSIVQQNALSTHRARILSVYQLVMFGGSPVGAALAGYLVRGYGIHNVLVMSVSTSAFFLISFALFSRLWQMQTHVTRMLEETEASSGP